MAQVDDVFVPVLVKPQVTTVGTVAKSSSCSVLVTKEPSRKLRPRQESAKFDEREVVKKIRAVVDQSAYSCDDLAFLKEHDSLVKLVKKRRSSYCKNKERRKEFEDEPEILQQSCVRLAEALRASKHAIIYTGAGISTSANIPDYRGPDGVWTKLQDGRSISVDQNLVTATPTFTHMTILKLLECGILNYIVSQNCDGLHIRSGVSPKQISEIHGNMFSEICTDCGKQFYRIFDVTQRTGLRRHMTSRTCDVCRGQLKDTIVHFGEKGDSGWPHCWKEAESNVENADLVLCLGSSLKVLRCYKQLWLTDRPKKSRPKLYIVNMQWTPKDSQSVLKIHGRSDDVMRRVMDHLGLEVSSYDSDRDALLRLATPIAPSESETFQTRTIRIPKSHAHLFVTAHERKPDHVSGDVVAMKDQQCLAKLPGLNESECPDQSRDEIASAQSEMPAWFGKGRRKVVARKHTKRKRKRPEFRAASPPKPACSS